MAVYSIKDLANISGIKAHTIRMWEKRYSIMTPMRTKTNIRYYNDSNLKQLLNIALLNKNGIKISKIANMCDREIGRKVSAISEVNFNHDTQLDALTIAMMQMDQTMFNRILSADIKHLGFERTMVEVINPFLGKLQVLWLTGSITPIHERFTSCLIRQKIIVAIDNLSKNYTETGKKFLIFLPEGENQELSLLFLHYLIKVRNHEVIYLGTDVCLDDLITAGSFHYPDFLFTILSATYAKRPCQDFVDSLSSNFSESQILLTLSPYLINAPSFNLPSNTLSLNDLKQTISFLDKL